MLLGLTALAVLAAARFVLIPWTDSWLGARDRITADARQVSDYQARISRAMGQRARLAAAYGPSVHKPPQSVEAARVALFKAVQDVLAANGFRPTDYQPQADRALKEVPGVRAVPLEIRGQCGLEQLTKCLAGMRKSDTLLILDRLSATGDDNGSGQLAVTMTLTTLARQEGGS